MVSWTAVEWGDRPGAPATPPLVVWRFAEPRPLEFAEMLHTILNADHREIDWVFDTTRRNWVLTPARVLVDKERPAFATEARAVDLLKREDPAFCRRSVSDFDQIIGVLDREA